MLTVTQFDNRVRRCFISVFLAVVANVLFNDSVAHDVLQVVVDLMLIGSKIGTDRQACDVDVVLAAGSVFTRIGEHVTDVGNVAF